MKPQLHSQLITHTIYNEIWTGHIAYITQPQEFGSIDEDKNNKYTKSVIKVIDSLITKGNFEGNMGILNPDSRFVPSQWEMTLQSNNISHWLVAT